MKRLIIAIIILAASVAWGDNQGDYKHWHSGEVGWCDDVAPPYIHEKSQDQDTLVVETQEWIGYCGNSPNRTFRLDTLIDIAKERYKEKWVLKDIYINTITDMYGGGGPIYTEYRRFNPETHSFSSSPTSQSCIDSASYPCIRDATLTFIKKGIKP